jgi:hypothetical protein
VSKTPLSTQAATGGREPTATEQAIRSITSDRQLLAEFCFELIGQADERVTTDDEASTRVCAYARAHADDVRLADVDLDEVRWHVVGAAIVAAVAPSRAGRPSRSAERAALLGTLMGRAWSRLEHAATDEARDSREPVTTLVGTAASEATEGIAGTVATLAEIRASDPEVVGDISAQLSRQVERWLFDVATSGGKSMLGWSWHVVEDADDDARAMHCIHCGASGMGLFEDIGCDAPASGNDLAAFTFALTPIEQALGVTMREKAAALLPDRNTDLWVARTATWNAELAARALLRSSLA